jgi:hypothetical protein
MSGWKAAACSRAWSRPGPTWPPGTCGCAAKNTSEYDLAVSLLRDLREVTKRQGQAEQFSKRVLGIRERYWNRPALQERLDPIGRGARVGRLDLQAW